MLSDQIRSAQAGNCSDMLALIERLTPIIRKYGRKLDPEDGLSEMTLCFIELVHQLQIERLKCPSDGAVVNYILRCLYHFYIKLKNNQYNSRAFYLEDLPEKQKSTLEMQAAQEETPFEWTLPQNTLTDKEKMIITLIYEGGYSSAEIAKHLGVTRQNVNQIKKRAESKIKESLKKNL